MSEDPLPLPDYDQLPAASIEYRIRPLERRDVQRLLDHEREHAARPQVEAFLTARLRELDAGARPSGGDPEAEQPDRPESSAHGSAASPERAAEPGEPLRHGKYSF
ncbi:hypothetical protein [Streptomyces xiaopingdaonensis]|uniref:hypothetical protein n=1 Tax=Streptomyces xiaopingdaonensis TaxID=1565415 RepID=UPI0003099AEF|nr:hypothetical protein [Streptomyces xiaopingdaonensis]